MGVHRLGGQDTTVISILFTLVGAFLMSFIKVTDKRLKLEAVIGIIYAVSSAVTVLMISKAAHGDADIQEEGCPKGVLS